MTPKPKSGPRPSDKWIPWYIALGFIVMLTPLAPMAYYAVHTLPGVVTDKAYEEGIAYNKSIAAGVQEKTLGWHGEIALEAPAAEANITYILLDAQSAPVSDAAVHVWLVRPVQGGMDRDFDMKPEGNGHYSVTAPLPSHGVWDIRVSATKQNANFQTEKRVVLP